MGNYSGKTCGSSMLQLRYGLYTEVQDGLWGDGSAGVLQRAGKSGANGALGLGILRGGARKTDA